MSNAAEKLDEQVENAVSDAELDALLAMEMESEEVVEETATESEQPEIEVLHVHSETDAAEETSAAAPKKAKASKPKRPSLSGLKNSEAIAALTKDPKPYLVFRKSEAKLSQTEFDALAEKRLAEFDAIKHVKMGKKCLNVFDWMANGKSLTKFTKMALDAIVAKGEMTTKELKQVYLDRPYQDKTASSVSSQMARILCIFGIADRDSDGKLVLSSESTIAEMIRSGR